MRKLITLIVLTLITTKAKALESWSFNLGYNNPPGTSAGANFLKIWSNWAIELGTGTQANSPNASNTNPQLPFGVSVKYVFSGNNFRPYIQAMVAGGSINSSGASVSTTFSPGAGVFWDHRSWYLYGGANLYNGNISGFAGLGFDF
jgi:hypothetical protein